MADMHTVETDMSVLAPYVDKNAIASWSKGAMAYAIQTGIFAPGGSLILPKQLATNAEVLAWVRAARYPAP